MTALKQFLWGVLIALPLGYLAVKIIAATAYANNFNGGF